MLKLKHKYNSNNFSIGDVIKIFYIVFLKTKKKKKKMYAFVGLCVYKNFNSFKLINIIRKEKIAVMFEAKSPLIYKLIVLKLYLKLVFRSSKIYFNLNNKYKDDLKNNDNIILSTFENFTYNFMFSALFKKKAIKLRKKIRKFRRKYFNTENWKNLKKIVGDIFNKV